MLAFTRVRFLIQWLAFIELNSVDTTKKDTLFLNAPFLPEGSSYTNIDSIGRGYSLPHGNPRDPSGVVDPGFRAPVLHLSHSLGRFSGDANFALPNYVEVSVEQSSSFSSSVVVVSSEQEYKSLLEQSVNLDVSTEASFWKASVSAKFSMSQSYESTVEGFVSTGSTLIDMVGETLSYRARLHTPFEPSPAFAGVVIALPVPDEDIDNYSSLDDSFFAPYDALLDNFGTHFATEVLMGGRAVKRYALTSSDTETFESTLAETALFGELDGSVKSVFLSFSASAQFDRQSALQAEAASALSTTNVTRTEWFLGGLPGFGSDDSLDSLKEWSSTVASSPAPIWYNLEEITNLLTADFFFGEWKDDDIAIKKKLLLYRMEELYSTGGSVACGDNVDDSRAEGETAVRYGDIVIVYDPVSGNTLVNTPNDAARSYFDNAVISFTQPFLDPVLTPTDGSFYSVVFPFVFQDVAGSAMPVPLRIFMTRSNKGPMTGGPGSLLLSMDGEEATKLRTFSFNGPVGSDSLLQGSISFKSQRWDKFPVRFIIEFPQYVSDNWAPTNSGPTSFVNIGIYGGVSGGKNAYDSARCYVPDDDANFPSVQLPFYKNCIMIPDDDYHGNGEDELAQCFGFHWHFRNIDLDSKNLSSVITWDTTGVLDDPEPCEADVLGIVGSGLALAFAEDYSKVRVWFGYVGNFESNDGNLMTLQDNDFDVRFAWKPVECEIGNLFPDLPAGWGFIDEAVIIGQKLFLIKEDSFVVYDGVLDVLSKSIYTTAFGSGSGCTTVEEDDEFRIVAGNCNAAAPPTCLSDSEFANSADNFQLYSGPVFATLEKKSASSVSFEEYITTAQWHEQVRLVNNKAGSAEDTYFPDRSSRRALFRIISGDQDNNVNRSPVRYGDRVYLASSAGGVFHDSDDDTNTFVDDWGEFQQSQWTATGTTAQFRLRPGQYNKAQMCDIVLQSEPITIEVTTEGIDSSASFGQYKPLVLATIIDPTAIESDDNPIGCCVLNNVAVIPLDANTVIDTVLQPQLYVVPQNNLVPKFDDTYSYTVTSATVDDILATFDDDDNSTSSFVLTHVTDNTRNVILEATSILNDTCMYVPSIAGGLLMNQNGECALGFASIPVGWSLTSYFVPSSWSTQSQVDPCSAGIQPISRTQRAPTRINMPINFGYGIGPYQTRPYDAYSEPIDLDNNGRYHPYIPRCAIYFLKLEK